MSLGLPPFSCGVRVVTEAGGAGTGRCSLPPFHGLLLNKEVVGASTGGPISQATSPYTTFLEILKDQIEIGICPFIYRRTHAFIKWQPSNRIQLLHTPCYLVVIFFSPNILFYLSGCSLEQYNFWLISEIKCKAYVNDLLVPTH